MAALLPEPPEGPGGLLGPFELAGLDGPPQGGPDVGVLQVAPVEPDALVKGDEVGLGLGRQPQVVLGVAPVDRAGVSLGPELLLGELADRLQHREARLGPLRSAHDDQGLVHQ